jgi:serine/threonine protein kinase
MSQPTGTEPSVTPVTNRPSSPPPPTPSPIKFLGKGSYGCAVKPALPNMNPKGDWVQYPDNITKIFFDKNNGLNAVESQTTIKELLKNNSHRINEYKYDIYTPYYLPENTRKLCFGENTSKYPAHIYPVRLPDLGKSIADLDANTIKKIQRVNVFTILEQMNKLVQQVNDLYNKGYIHGDIREPNVMIKPETGLMTIIDFDWLRKKEVFFKDYYHALGFYNNPPESLMTEGMPWFYTVANNYRELLQAIEVTVSSELLLKNSKIKKYMTIQNSVLKFRGPNYKNNELTKNDIVDIFAEMASMVHEECKSKVPTKGSKGYMEKIFGCFFDRLGKTFDSFGLGFTLLEFIAHIYGRIMFYPYSPQTRNTAVEHFRDVRLTDGDRKYTTEEAKQIYMSLGKYINYVLLPMANDYPSKRISIQEAAKRSQELINGFREMIPNASKELSRMELLTQYNIPFIGKLVGGKTRKNKRQNKKRYTKTLKRK